jgi:hypothetical protein
MQRASAFWEAMVSRLAFAAMALLLTTPAMAGAVAQVPEGDSITLFALGVAGVILGRRLSMRRSRKDRDAD